MVIRELVQMLQDTGIENAEQEVRWILEDIPDTAAAREIVRRRANHEPLQYLLGAWEFYGLRIKVGKGVLIPRADTEALVDVMLADCQRRYQPHIVDLCTGSGCIALALQSQLPDAHIIGIEKDPDTCECYAKANAAYHRLNVEMRCGDVLDPNTAAAFHDLDGIVCNPPYLTESDMQALQLEVQHEPKLALYGGQDGLHFYRLIPLLWKPALKSGGILAFEVGIHQADAVRQILEQTGYHDIRIIPDLCGIPRVVSGIV